MLARLKPSRGERDAAMPSEPQTALHDIRDAILLARTFVEGYDFARFRADKKTSMPSRACWRSYRKRAVT